MDALETIFNERSFNDEGFEGTWLVDHDDLYVSESKYKDFFYYEDEADLVKTNSRVVFKIKDYDMVGPDDFHVDNKLDKLRDNWGLPWLSVDITFTAEQNMIPELMQI